MVEETLVDPFTEGRRRPLPPLRLPSLSLEGGYAEALRAIPMLDADEEHQLAVAWSVHGDAEAANRLVMHHLRQAQGYARRYAGAVDEADLFQEGTLGLLRAVEGFDPYAGVRFAAYAKLWITSTICRYLQANHSLVDFAAHRAGRHLFYNLGDAREALANPTPEAIADYLGVPLADVVAVSQHMDAPAASLSAPVKVGGDKPRQLQEVVSNGEGSTESTADAARAVEEVRGVLAVFGRGLSGDEAVIWSMRLAASEPLPVPELAERLRVPARVVEEAEEALRGRLLAVLAA